MTVRIKFCGFTNPEEVAIACELGVDAIGFNFYPKSPRYLDPRQARPVIEALHPTTAGIGLFVDQPFRQAAAISYQLGLRGIQWYADPRLNEEVFPFTLLPAFRVKDADTLKEIAILLQILREQNRLPKAILLDAYSPQAMGGTGHQAPWEILSDFKPGVPIILAGGLMPENIAEAIKVVQPYGVDVASGIESTPGKKDRARMQAFVEAVRQG
jgi:phosphoribosylanthranilate isomerase